MYDLYVPSNIYEREIGKLKALPAKVQTSKIHLITYWSLYFIFLQFFY